MIAPTILVSITTTDTLGNYIQNSEKRIFGQLQGNPSVTDYCEIFFNTLSKQEFSKDEIAKGIHEFFISTDKEKLSK